MERTIIANDLHQLTDDNLDTVTGGVVFVVPLAWAVATGVAGMAAGAGAVALGLWIASKR